MVEAFGIIGMSLGTMGFILGIITQGRIDKLENILKELGVLDQEFKSG